MPYVPPTTSVHSPVVQPLPLSSLAQKNADSRSDTNDTTEQNKDESKTPYTSQETAPLKQSDNDKTTNLDDQVTPAFPSLNHPSPTTTADPLPSTSTSTTNIPLDPPTSLPLPALRPSRTVSLDIIDLDRTPPIPRMTDALSSNFAAGNFGQGHVSSDTAVHTLKDVAEGETIRLAHQSEGVVDMPKFPGNETGTDIGADVGLPDLKPLNINTQIDDMQVQGPGEGDEEDDQGVPDLVPSRSLSVSDVDTQAARDGSSTSLDTMSETPSPLTPGDGFAGQEGEQEQVVVVQQGEEEDPRIVALHKYKEGLYTYTRGLWLEAKSSSTRSDKRRASASSGSGQGSGSFGAKQSGMERLAAKKALARRLNA